MLKNTLLADSITLSFGDLEVLRGAWISSETGKVTGLLGRNGSGKSCIFRSIMGCLRPQNHFVRINDEVMTGSSTMGLHVRYLPQKPFLPPGMRLSEIFGYFGADYGLFVQDFPKFEIYYNNKVRELSGGEQRILEIWLVLCSGAPFCILDEPFSYLGPIAIEAVQKIIDRQKRTTGIIISDHNYEALLDVSDEVLLLSDGYVHQVRDRSDLVKYGYCRA